MRQSLRVTLIILPLLIQGCIEQPAPKKEIKYVYKTEYRYIYFPCEKEQEIIKPKSAQKALSTKAEKVIESKLKNYDEPSEKMKKYAPESFIIKPNKPMDFMIGINSDGSEFVYLEGEFSESTYEQFEHFLNESNTQAKEIKINSNGGVLASAMKIGEFVYKNGWRTGVDKEMRCLSACTFVYFAGKEKSLQGEAILGLHRPYTPGVPDTLQNVNAIKAQFISYWNYIRAPKSIYDEMMYVDRDDLFILNRENITQYIDVKLQ